MQNHFIQESVLFLNIYNNTIVPFLYISSYCGFKFFIIHIITPVCFSLFGIFLNRQLLAACPFFFEFCCYATPKRSVCVAASVISPVFLVYLYTLFANISFVSTASLFVVMTIFKTSVSDAFDTGQIRHS